MFKVIALAILFGVVVNLSAQFAPAFLQNESYWGDGKAEFNFYDAQIVREGQPMPPLPVAPATSQPATATPPVSPKQ